MTKVHTWTITGLGALALVLAAILAGMAVTSAQEGTATPTATPEATTDAGDDGAADDGTTDDADDTDDSEDTGVGICAGGGHGTWRLAEDAAGEVLGMTHAELRDAFDDGQTLAEIAEAQGMSADDLQAAVVESVTATLQEKLDEGDITQDQFDDLTADLAENIAAFITEAAPERGGTHGFGVWRLVEDAVATVLGLTEDALHDGFANGQTLAEIGEAQGVSADDLKAGIIENVTAELQSRLDDGDITQEQFDDLTAGLNENIDDIINSVGPMRGHGGRHGGFGHGGFGPGFYFDDGSSSTDDTTETTVEA
jgi:uncharacterized protein YdeI (YjbR/CyaY-like superfamily)